MKHHALAATIFTVFSLCLGVFVLASGSENGLASAMMFVTYLMICLVYAWVVWSYKLRALSFLVLMYCAFAFILPGLYQIRTDQFYWMNGGVRRDLIPLAALMTSLGMFAMVTGYFAPRWQRNGRASSGLKADYVPSELSRRTQSRMSWAALLISMIAFGWFALNFAKFGAGMFFGTREQVALQLIQAGATSTTFALAQTLSRALAISSLIIAGLVSKRLTRKGWAIYFAVALSLLASFITCFPLSSPRFWMIALFMSIFMTFYPNAFKSAKGFIFVAGPAAMFVVFPFLGMFNRRGDSLNFSLSGIDPLAYMAHGDLDGFQSMINVLNLTEVDGYAYGGRMLTSLLFFVPRSIWSGKYEPTGSDAAQVSGYDFLNISMPLPGEFFSDFGVIGLVIGMFFVGKLVRYLDLQFDEVMAGKGRLRDAMLAVMFSAFAAIIFRGPILSIVPGPMIGCVLVFLFFYVMRLRFR